MNGWTDSCQRGGEGTGGKKGKGAAEELVWLTRGHTQQCGAYTGKGGKADKGEKIGGGRRQ